jgi:ABC-type branched-subunit amino acid transport system substrate-binding protein
LVSLDDSGEVDMAVEQARKLALDPQIVGVVGHWLEATTVAAAPKYASAGLPFLATAGSPDLSDASFRLWPRSPCHLVTPSGCIDALEDLRLRGADALTVTVPAPLPADSTDPGFADRYRAISGGVEPRFNAVLAYDAARLLLDAIARDIGANGRPGRAGVEVQLAQSDYVGLSGHFRFGPDRAWTEARNWLYRWSDGQLIP